MAFQECPDIAQTLIRAQNNGQDCFTVLNWRDLDPPITLGHLTTLASILNTTWIEEFLPLLCSSYVASTVEATDLSVEEGAVWEEAFPGANKTGLRELEVMPNNVTIAIQHNGGVASRSAHGRSFWPVLARQDVSNNAVSIFRVALMVQAFENMQTALYAFGWNHVVLSRWHNKVKRPTGVGYGITSYNVDNLNIDSMRRRLPGRGA